MNFGSLCNLDLFKFLGKMTVKRKGTDSSSVAVSWTIENELKLYKAALKYKPTGILKHFNMALIFNELTKGGMKDVTTQAIWDHLSELYDLEAANELESCMPGPEDSDTEFSLPKKEFMEVLNEMKKTDLKECVDAKEESSKKSNNAPQFTSGPETPKTSTKRPTRSTPGSGPASAAKRRK